MKQPPCADRRSQQDHAKRLVAPIHAKLLHTSSVFLLLQGGLDASLDHHSLPIRNCAAPETLPRSDSVRAPTQCALRFSIGELQQHKRSNAAGKQCEQEKFAASARSHGIFMVSFVSRIEFFEREPTLGNTGVPLKSAGL